MPTIYDPHPAAAAVSKLGTTSSSSSRHRRRRRRKANASSSSSSKTPPAAAVPAKDDFDFDNDNDSFQNASVTKKKMKVLVRRPEATTKPKTPPSSSFRQRTNKMSSGGGPRRVSFSPTSTTTRPSSFSLTLTPQTNTTPSSSSSRVVVRADASLHMPSSINHNQNHRHHQVLAVDTRYLDTTAGQHVARSFLNDCTEFWNHHHHNSGGSQLWAVGSSETESTTNSNSNSPVFVCRPLSHKDTLTGIPLVGSGNTTHNMMMTSRLPSGLTLAASWNLVGTIVTEIVQHHQEEALASSESSSTTFQQQPVVLDLFILTHHVAFGLDVKALDTTTTTTVHPSLQTLWHDTLRPLVEDSSGSVTLGQVTLVIAQTQTNSKTLVVPRPRKNHSNPKNPKNHPPPLSNKTLAETPKQVETDMEQVAAALEEQPTTTTSAGDLLKENSSQVENPSSSLPKTPAPSPSKPKTTATSNASALTTTSTRNEYDNEIDEYDDSEQHNNFLPSIRQQIATLEQATFQANRSYIAFDAAYLPPVRLTVMEMTSSSFGYSLQSILQQQRLQQVLQEHSSSSSSSTTSTMTLVLPETADGMQCSLSLRASYTKVVPLPAAPGLLRDLELLNDDVLEPLQLVPISLLDASLLYGVPMSVQAAVTTTSSGSSDDEDDDEMEQFQEMQGLVQALLSQLVTRDCALLLQRKPTSTTPSDNNNDDMTDDGGLFHSTTSPQLFVLLPEEVPPSLRSTTTTTSTACASSTGILFRYASADQLWVQQEQSNHPSLHNSNPYVEQFVTQSLEQLDCQPINPLFVQYQQYQKQRSLLPNVVTEPASTARSSSISGPVDLNPTTATNLGVASLKETALTPSTKQNDDVTEFWNDTGGVGATMEDTSTDSDEDEEEEPLAASNSETIHLNATAATTEASVNEEEAPSTTTTMAHDQGNDDDDNGAASFWNDTSGVGVTMEHENDDGSSSLLERHQKKEANSDPSTRSKNDNDDDDSDATAQLPRLATTSPYFSKKTKTKTTTSTMSPTSTTVPSPPISQEHLAYYHDNDDDSEEELSEPDSTSTARSRKRKLVLLNRSIAMLTQQVEMTTNQQGAQQRGECEWTDEDGEDSSSSSSNQEGANDPSEAFDYGP